MKAVATSAPIESQRRSVAAGRRIAFVHVGSFSMTNDVVLGMLRRGFPDAEIEVVDLGRLLRRRPLTWLVSVLAMMVHMGPAVLLQRGRRWRALFATPLGFRVQRRALRRRLAGGDYAFTVQTQSLFDASTPGTPHFVYTDHTARMNAHYELDPSDIEARISDAWIEQEAGIYRHATRILTQTERAAASVRDDYGVPAERVVCVHAGIHVTPPSRDAIEAKSYAAQEVLYVGTDWRRKGGDRLLEAFRRVRQRHPDARLTIVGPCPRGVFPEPDVHAGVGPRRVEPGIELAGVVPLGELRRYYERATIFCMPTRREPLGYAFLEAAAFGLPIVSTRIGSMPEIVLEGESGLLVPPGDVDALAGALSKLLDSASLRRDLGRRGRAHLHDVYRWDRVEGQLIGELRVALGEHLPAAGACESGRGAA